MTNVLNVTVEKQQGRVRLTLVEGARDDLERIIAENDSPEDALHAAFELHFSRDWMYVSPQTLNLPEGLFVITPEQGAVVTPSCEVYPYEWVASVPIEENTLENVLDHGQAYMPIKLIKMSLTYRELMVRLLSLPVQFLDTDVTVYIDGEYRQIKDMDIEPSNGVLDKGHPYLTDKPSLEEDV